MGNCLGNDVINPGAVLDRVISQSSGEDDCVLYKLANYQKGGELTEAYSSGGVAEVQRLVQEQFGILMYNGGKGQVISRTEFLRWKFRNHKHVSIPVEPSGSTDPLAKWEDHLACWQMQYRGSLGETLLHLLIICDTRIHTKLARILLKNYPKLALDVVEGEEYFGASALHLAIAYSNDELVHLLTDCGANIEQRATGSFFLPRDQQRVKPKKTTDYEGLAYLGEYPLAWAACTNSEGVYNHLIDLGADPDRQDSFGNMILHMVVVTDQLCMYGYALRHPHKKASNDIANNQGLTPLTLACRLGRASVFKEMLELSCREFWRYSNITCSAYPLGALDTLLPDGRTNWNSALFMILAGSKEEHLDMLDGGIIQRLLEEKWKTFAQRQFLKRITIAFIHLICLSGAVYLRPRDRSKSLLDYSDTQDIVRLLFELGTVAGCISFVVFQQGEEIKNQGFITFLRQLPQSPPKVLFIVANFLILLCIPYRYKGDIRTEETLLAFSMIFSWFFMIFFAGAVKLTGPFVTMVYSMIVGDMLTFSIIYFIILLGFSQSFFYVYKTHPDRKNTLFTDYSATWMGLYHWTLGSYEYSEFEGTAYPIATKAVFIVFMIMVPILLLNMLIAMMGNTYSQVIERSEKEWVKQWAKIVVTLERAVDQESAMQYIQEYSIKLSGTDPSNEVRGVLVIKSKSKTKAKQRKGALSNWKRVGKVTINALKRRKMTGEQMRRLMWGHRDSISTPQNATPRAQSLVPDYGTHSGAEGKLDGTIDQLAMAGELKTNVDGNPVPEASVPGTSSEPKTTSQSYTPKDSKTMKPHCEKEMEEADGKMDANKICRENNLPIEHVSGSKCRGRPGGIKKRNVKLGSRPTIVIFSDKKDLIHVSLDSEADSDNEMTDEHILAKKSKQTKSSRRRSIAGSIWDSTPTESDNDEDVSKPALLKPTGHGSSGDSNIIRTMSKDHNSGQEVQAHDNLAFEPDTSVDSHIRENQVAEKGNGEGQKDDEKMESEPQVESDNSRLKDNQRQDDAAADSTMNDEIDVEKSINRGKKRPKSAKPTVTKDDRKRGGNETEQKGSDVTERPHTGIDRWSTKDISSMSKLVAWEQDEEGEEEEEELLEEDEEEDEEISSNKT